MFKLQRPSKPRERLDFKFSNFQALQVPKGWDRLVVTLISVGTGKTIAKLGKALVNNGSCQWTETLSEFIWISRDNSSKEYEESFVKIVVSMGSSKSGTLGEATINLANFTGSRVSTAISQPLKKCSYGTILQVKIQCVAPRTKIRDEESNYASSQEEELESSGDGTVGPQTYQGPAATSNHVKLDSKETSQSESGLNHSFDPIEDSIERENISTRNSLPSEKYNNSNKIQGEGVFDDSPIPDNYSIGNESPYFRDGMENETTFSRPSLTNVGSSKNLLEVAEDAIQELRAEAKMWERKARKLMIDLDIFKKEFSDLSTKKADVAMELSVSHAEQDTLKREVEQVKLELQTLTVKHATHEDPSERVNQIQKVLENEINYQQDMNANLEEQLKRTQESNIELVTVVQELEETIEQQKIEIENLSSLKLEFTDLEKFIARNSEDYRNLVIQVEQLQESETALQAEVNSLEQALREKSSELENKRKLKLSDNDENNVNLIREVESLKEKIEELEKDCAEITDENLELLFKLKDSNKKEIRERASIDSTPSDESVVTEPNDEIKNSSLEHLFEIWKQLKIASNLVIKPWCGILSEEYNDFLRDFLNTSEGHTKKKISGEHVLRVLFELNKLLEKRITECEEICRRHEIEIKGKNDFINDAEKKMEEYILVIQEHEKYKAKFEVDYADKVKELENKRSEVDHMKADLFSKEEMIELQNQKELEIKISELQQKNSHLEEKCELVFSERNIISESIENLQNDNIVLRNTIDSHVSDSAILERNLLELESEKDELEVNLSGLQDENVKLHESISNLEVQIEILKDEKEFFQKEIDNSKSVAMSLQDEIHNLNVEMNIQLVDLQQKLEGTEKQLRGAQLEHEYLKSENQTVLKKTTEFESLQNEVDNLKRQIADTHELQDLFQEVQSKSELAKKELDSVREESNMKVQDLMDQLTTSKQNHEILMADHERILKMLANYKRSEEKLKTDINDLELKLTISDYERQELTKEMGALKVQLQTVSGLEDEIAILKLDIKECKVDKSKLEVALQTVSRDYEELNTVKISLSEEISSLRDTKSEFEECKSRKSVLEEKVLQMEKDLAVKNILHTQNSDPKNELTKIKRANVQFQQKIRRVEEEKEKWLKKAQSLEDDLKRMDEKLNFNRENFDDESPLAVSVNQTTKEQLHEKEASDAWDVNIKNTGQHESSLSGEQNSNAVPRESYERTKSSIETELKDLSERYLEMSLKYAEVEAQREDLVMKLKATGTGKKWFS